MVKAGKEEGFAVLSYDIAGSGLDIGAVIRAHVGEIKGDERSV